MQSSARAISVATLLFAASATWASQPCTYVAGNANTEQYAANFVKLAYLGTGPGFNDDKPLLEKSLFAWGGAFDPLLTHTVHVIMQDTNTGLTLWTANVPPSATLWTHPAANKWTFSDPATTYGVRTIKVTAPSPGYYLITLLKGKNTNIMNAPVTANVSKAYVRVEIESGGVGVCYEGDSGLGVCTTSGNTQICRYH